MILGSGGGKSCGGEGNEDRPGYTGRQLCHSSLLHLYVPLLPSSFGCLPLCICSIYSVNQSMIHDYALHHKLLVLLQEVNVGITSGGVGLNSGSVGFYVKRCWINIERYWFNVAPVHSTLSCHTHLQGCQQGLKNITESKFSLKYR